MHPPRVLVVHLCAGTRFGYEGKIGVPNDTKLKRFILKEAHKSSFSIHPGATKMYQYLKKDYWWPGMKTKIAEFVARCIVCQQVKIKHQRPTCLLEPLEIPQWKWEKISMDFVGGLPRTQIGHDSILVIVDRLTKSAHFLPVKSTYRASQYAELFISENVKLHKVPASIGSMFDIGLISLRSKLQIFQIILCSLVFLTGDSKVRRSFPYVIWFSCVYVIWKERNNRISFI